MILRNKDDYFTVEFNLKLWHTIFERSGILHKLNNWGLLTKQEILAIDQAMTEISNLADVIKESEKNEEHHTHVR
jgi:hypothetical protein